MDFTSQELDLLYECVRLQANDLRNRSIDASEPGSWADRIFQLNRRLTSNLHKRRQTTAY